MKKSDDWREFEKLVSRFEKVAAPCGAEVKSPDHIRDLTTGQLREVDASIRTKVGTTEILITVECRKRDRKDDVTWIEQLATKRQRIGAAKTIAVSSSGFTGPAIKSAQYSGIELRTLSEVSASDIQGWFLSGGVVHVFRLIENIRCSVVFYEDSGEPSKYAFWVPDVDAALFYHDEHKSPFPIRDYIPILEACRPMMFIEGVSLDGSKVELNFPIKWNPGELQVAFDTVKKSVHLTTLVATVSYQSAPCDISSGVHHEYANPDGTVVQRTMFNTELLGMPVIFEHQSDLSGKQKVSCKFSPKSKNKNKD